MSRKSKIKKALEEPSIDYDCFECLEALYKCVQESNPATRAMLKEKSTEACKSCTHYHSINSKKK